MNWTPLSWNQLTALQQPLYQNPQQMHDVCRHIAGLPPLVSTGEIEALKTQIAEAGLGKRFILQAGDCAETFADCNSKAITDKLKIILQMSLILVYGMRLPIVRIGRIAGQYAKPRSDNTETIDGVSLPSFRGDIINSVAFNPEARQPDPSRLLQAATHSCFTINWIRALIEGGFADVRHPELWRLDHVSPEAQPQLFSDLSKRISDATQFSNLINGSSDAMKRVDFFTSHEALLLNYESAFVRQIGHKWYNLNSHFLWLGERTRQIDGAHTHFLSGIANPIGIKVGPTADPLEIASLVQKINPTNEPGKVTIITRLGAGKAAQTLPPLLEAIARKNLFVTYSCDPMHGNAIRSQNGIKTRDFNSILSELTETEQTIKACGKRLGGVHFELTGENVTECLGGGVAVSEAQLSENYQTACDPRLNYSQSMEMSYLISEQFGRY